jgi:hypothetical protein
MGLKYFFRKKNQTFLTMLSVIRVRRYEDDMNMDDVYVNQLIKQRLIGLIFQNVIVGLESNNLLRFLEKEASFGEKSEKNWIY